MQTRSGVSAKGRYLTEAFPLIPEANALGSADRGCLEMLGGIRLSLEEKSGLIREVEGTPLRVRPTSESDIDYVLEAERNEENRPYVGQWTQEAHVAAIGNGDMAHLILEAPGGRRVGYAILVGIAAADGKLQLQRIVVTEKGEGYGRQALQLLKRMAFSEFGAHRFWLRVRARNQRARRLYLSEGFVEEGTSRDSILVDGRYESIITLSILRQEYRP